MSKSKKLLVSLLLSLAVFSMTANATVSRLEALGGAPDDFWWGLPGNIFVLHDAATPGVWPQLVQQYPNLAGGEFNGGYDVGTGNWDMEKVYVNYSWGEKRAALQFSLDKLSSTRFFNNAFDGFDGIPCRLNINYGRKMSDNLLFGLGLSYAGESADSDIEGVEAEAGASVIGLKLGLSGIGDYEWDIVAGLELANFTNEQAGQTVAENDGSMGFHFAGRYWWHYAETASLIPNLRFNTYTDAAKFEPAGSASTANTQIGIGVGHNWWPVENALVLFDVGVLLHTVDVETDNGTVVFEETAGVNSLPYWRIGFETTVFSWLDGRLGAERHWLAFTDERGNDEINFSTSETMTFLGATAHWNRMVLDLVVNPAFIAQGPDFISGAGSDAMFTRVSLKYDFNQ